MSNPVRRRRSFAFRYVLRPLWRALKIILMAFCGLGPGMPPHEPRARTAVEQHESGPRAGAVKSRRA
jgi:hypothetical protein